MLNHRIELNRKDEIGALATSFNQMAESIEKSHVHLEETVNQKTTELRVIAELSGKVFKGDITLNSILEHCIEIITEKMGFTYSVLCFIEKDSGLLTHEIKRGATKGFCDLEISQLAAPPQEAGPPQQFWLVHHGAGLGTCPAHGEHMIDHQFLGQRITPQATRERHHEG